MTDQDKPDLPESRAAPPPAPAARAGCRVAHGAWLGESATPSAGSDAASPFRAAEGLRGGAARAGRSAGPAAALRRGARAARNEGELAGGDRAEIVARLSEAQYLSHLRKRVERLHPADVAYVLEALPREERLLVWDSVKAEADGAILLEVSEPVRDSLIESMTRTELVAAVKELDADDLADLADHLPTEVVDEVRRQLTPEEREQLRAAMSYPEDSVGARMDFDLVTVREDVKLEVVLRYLRRFDELPQHTDQVFVVDRYDMLKGSLPIDQLLINEPDATGLGSDEAGRAGAARARRRRRGGPGVRALRPGVGAGDRSARPPDRPADDRRGGRRDPRGGRSRRAVCRPACARRRTSSPRSGIRRATAGCGWR